MWKREQAAAQEDAKLKEYQKQLQEERAKDELAAVAEAGGGWGGWRTGALAGGGA